MVSNIIRRDVGQARNANSDNVLHFKADRLSRFDLLLENGVGVIARHDPVRVGTLAQVIDVWSMLLV
jgi:hypothetical protein